jgi:hypothetical protein
MAGARAVPVAASVTAPMKMPIYAHAVSSFEFRVSSLELPSPDRKLGTLCRELTGREGAW